MEQNKKQLTKLLDFVKELYNNPDNKEFAAGLDDFVLSKLAITTNDNIEKIKAALEIRAGASIDYSFVNDDSVRKQLVADNLRMENAILNLSDSEKERYEKFCVNAFLQVENILNYYYCEKYDKDIANILTDIENATKNDQSIFNRTSFKIEYKYVSDISMYIKIQAFCNQFFPRIPGINDYTASNLHKLKNMRNNFFHRAGKVENSLKNDAAASKQIPPTTTMFRDTLRRLVKKVKEQLH